MNSPNNMQHFPLSYFKSKPTYFVQVNQLYVRRLHKETQCRSMYTFAVVTAVLQPPMKFVNIL